MIFTLNINLTAQTAGRGKRGFFAPGEAAQKKLYTAEHVPSSAGAGALIFTLLPLAYAAAEIPLNFSRMADSAAFRSGHHRSAGSVQTTHRRAPWATSAGSLLGPDCIQTSNPLKSFPKNILWSQSQLCTKENEPQ